MMQEEFSEWMLSTKVILSFVVCCRFLPTVRDGHKCAHDSKLDEPLLVQFAQPGVGFLRRHIRELPTRQGVTLSDAFGGPRRRLDVDAVEVDHVAVSQLD